MFKYVIESRTRKGVHHTTILDNRGRFASCTCEAGRRGIKCWHRAEAMQRHQALRDRYDEAACRLVEDGVYPSRQDVNKDFLTALKGREGQKVVNTICRLANASTEDERQFQIASLFFG